MTEGQISIVKNDRDGFEARIAIVGLYFRVTLQKYDLTGTPTCKDAEVAVFPVNPPVNSMVDGRVVLDYDQEGRICMVVHTNTPGRPLEFGLVVFRVGEGLVGDKVEFYPRDGNWEIPNRPKPNPEDDRCWA